MEVASSHSLDLSTQNKSRATRSETFRHASLTRIWPSIFGNKGLAKGLQNGLIFYVFTDEHRVRCAPHSTFCIPRCLARDLWSPTTFKQCSSSLASSPVPRHMREMHLNATQGWEIWQFQAEIVASKKKLQKANKNYLQPAVWCISRLNCVFQCHQNCLISFLGPFHTK